MNGKEFIRMRLSTTGWAPIDAELAKFLEPDAATYYRDYGAYLGDLPTLLFQFPGTKLCRVRINDRDVVVLTRSKDRLAERIAWVTGGNVEIVPDDKLESVKPYEPQNVSSKPMQRDKTPELIALARQEPPTHDCHLRREILRARTELDLSGIAWRA